jgi:hypothetical protein
LGDLRNSDLTAQTFLEMVRSRVHGSLAGYGDQNDYDLDGLIGTPAHHPADETGTAMPR